MNTKLKTLCREQTHLKEQDIAQLVDIVNSMPLYAELAQSYFFIDCMSKNNSQALVVAEAFPDMEKPLYAKSVVGKSVFESFEPGVFYTYREGKKSIIKHAINQEGQSVHQTVMPVRNKNQSIIAVLIQEKEIKPPQDIYVNESNLTIPTQVIDRILSPDDHALPVISDILMEMFILTNNEHQLIYANPVAIKFIVEMSQTDHIYKENLTTLLPFLMDVYEKNNEDVYVFELTIGQKSLFVKKIRLRQNDDSLNTLLIIQDLTDIKMKERELSKKSTMIQEIHHRVKNNLQTIASLLRIQMHQGVPNESYAMFEDALNRIFSISAVYELILANDEADPEYVDIIELAQKICSKLVLNSSFHKIDLIIRKNNNVIMASQKRAVSISLIVNELVQNALKHAFNEKKTGEVIVEFIYDKEGENIRIHVIDNGIGMEELKPSLGLDIVRNLVENDLFGTLNYEEAVTGTHALITFNLNSEVEIYRETDSIGRR